MTAAEAVQAIAKALSVQPQAEGQDAPPGAVAAAVAQLLSAHTRCRQHLHSEQKRQLSSHVQVLAPIAMSIRTDVSN